jgi:uncharacterized protein (TIGR02145 family)
MIIAGCAKDDPEKSGQIPEVSPVTVTGITSFTAHITGEVINEGDASVTERGFCFSNSPDPKITDSKKWVGKGKGSFDSELRSLSENTSYYLRAYATSTVGTAYSDVVSFTTLPTIADSEGNKYSIVTIGTQTWMAENLRSTKFSNGESLASMSWYVNTPSCCSFMNDPGISAIYGMLYNWYAANDARNICPTGWHVPSDAEWMTLVTYLGGFDSAAPKMKEAGTGHWIKDPGSNNSSGFTALGSGKKEETFYGDLNWFAFFWTKTPSEYSERYGVGYTFDLSNIIYRSNLEKVAGYSIRCGKD